MFNKGGRGERVPFKNAFNGAGCSKRPKHVNDSITAEATESLRTVDE